MTRTEALRRLDQRQTFRYEALLTKVVSELAVNTDHKAVFDAHPHLGVDGQVEACKRAYALAALRLL